MRQQMKQKDQLGMRKNLFELDQGLNELNLDGSAGIGRLI
jgi:hypothetical protein